jgi:hypothetical protein
VELRARVCKVIPMRQSWRRFCEGSDTSASRWLRALACLMAVCLFADQVTAASATYLNTRITEESGKEAGTRVVNAEEILPHFTPCLRIKVRSVKQGMPRAKSFQASHAVWETPVDLSRQIQILAARLRC